MCEQYLHVVYRAFVIRTGLRVAFIEQAISFWSDPQPLSEDEKRNEAEIYTALFSDECRSYVEELYKKAMCDMRGLPYASSRDILEGLAFLHEVVARALWKHHCLVGESLESFAREFDRLDVDSERERLHTRAQIL